MLRIIISASMVSVILAGCGNDLTQDIIEEGDNTYTTLLCPAVSTHSSIDEPALEVVNTASRFIELHSISDLDTQDTIEVDFNEQMVIAIHAGAKPSSNYEVRLVDVEKTASGIEVHYQTVSPSSSCTVDSAITYPYCFVAIEKTESPITFSESTLEECWADNGDSSHDEPNSSDPEIEGIDRGYSILSCPDDPGASNTEETARYEVINDFGQLEAAYPSLANNPLPEIDFENETVAAIFAGAFGTTGYRLRITEVKEQESSVHVHYTLASPDVNGCGVGAAYTNPHCFITTEKTDKTFEFHQTRVSECPYELTPL